MTDTEKIADLERQLADLRAMIPAIERQRDAAIKLLNRRNQELFDDHSSGVS